MLRFLRWLFMYAVVQFASTKFMQSQAIKTKRPNQRKRTKSKRVTFQSVTLLLGAEKAGTSSLKKILSQTACIHVHSKEAHYFDGAERGLKAFRKKGKSAAGFIKVLQNDFDRSATKNESAVNDFFEKTPRNLLVPGIAEIISTDMISHGSKAFALLRNPSSRFISNYFMGNPRNLIDQFTENFLSSKHFTEFNADIQSLYVDFKQNERNQTQVMDKLIVRYKKWLKRDVTHAGTRVWVRGCYSVQLIQWIRAIEKLDDEKRFKHSLKIVQSEKLFADDTFDETMDYITCYIQYHYDQNSRNFETEMKDCVNRKNRPQYSMVKKNSKTGSFVPSNELADSITASYQVCNDWLRELLQNDRFKHIILTEFDWSLWN